MTHKLLLGSITLAICASYAPAALAQAAYPDKTIRLVVPFSAGGALDVVGRILAQKLTESLGKQVVVDNRVGAGGNIGAEYVAKAAPDGYTLLMSSVTTMAINMNLTPKPPYDFERDYAPVSLNAAAPLTLMTHPALPAKSVKEFIAIAKARPGQLNYFSSGVGTGTHLAAVIFDQMAGVKTMHVPYKGAGQGVTDLLSGQMQFAFSTIQLALPHVQSGRLRMLGIGSLKRYPRLPELPAIAETVKGYEAVQLYGVVAPRGTPPQIVSKLAGELRTITAGADVQEKFLSQGIVPAPSTPEEFSRSIKQNIAQFAKVIKTLDLKVE
ncbi:MAG: tripartite tricarboxylate transporter substrate binding protein [Burkholderiales bacterium]|jgi:tripartite-type tricarboxylate transporter receptor subunit TctC|nr:tripartite tricarboxylate transporter substrate binding protein [Burkholderiales bacterium]